jgi:hypothetical protein
MLKSCTCVIRIKKIIFADKINLKVCEDYFAKFTAKASSQGF